jgi:putative tryptophan/tyrosine transport system substrate-binding protein
MRRRNFVAGISLMIGAKHLAAQQARRRARIALVHSGIHADQLTESGPTAWIREFFAELRKLGYTEGPDLIFERYSAEGQMERFLAVAQAVVSRNPDVIVTNGPLVNAFRTATQTLPILAIMGDPIRQGVASNLARPTANITGVSVDGGIELYGKQVEILKTALPSAKRIVYLSSPTSWDGALGQAVRMAAERLEISLVGIPIEEASPPEFRRAFVEAAKQHLDAVMVSPSGEFLAHRELIVQLAQTIRLPGMYPYRDFVNAGGLMAYAPDLLELARRLAHQVLQILSGSKPSDIAIYQPTTFKLILNLKTAQKLSFVFPPSILADADEIIE